MTTLEKAEQLLTLMTRSEKAQVLQWIVRDAGDAFPGIESNPGISGGEPCVVRTRIPVWVLVRARQLGTSEAELLRAYPSLRSEDLANAWAFYRSHGAEVDNRSTRTKRLEMARLFADENFPLPVTEKLRDLGHDVLTIQEIGKADRAVPDQEILAMASTGERAVLTINRKHFIRLSKEQAHVDPNKTPQNAFIHAVVSGSP